MDDAKPRSFIRRVGDFFYNWANGSEWSQLDAIMLAVGLWILGCLVIGGFFAANWIQSITPASKKHEMYAQMQQGHGQHGQQGQHGQHASAPSAASAATPLTPSEHMQAPPMAPMQQQYGQASPYAQSQAYGHVVQMSPAAMSASMSPSGMSASAGMSSSSMLDGHRSSRLYSNRIFGSSNQQRQIADPTQSAQAYQAAAQARQLASIQESYAPKYQRYELLSDQRQYSAVEVQQRFGSPRANADFPTTVNWQPFGRSTSGQANAFGAP